MAVWTTVHLARMEQALRLLSEARQGASPPAAAAHPVEKAAPPPVAQEAPPPPVVPQAPAPVAEVPPATTIRAFLKQAPWTQPPVAAHDASRQVTRVEEPTAQPPQVSLTPQEVAAIEPQLERAEQEIQEADAASWSADEPVAAQLFRQAPWLGLPTQPDAAAAADENTKSPTARAFFQQAPWTQSPVASAPEPEQVQEAQNRDDPSAEAFESELETPEPDLLQQQDTAQEPDFEEVFESPSAPLLPPNWQQGRPTPLSLRIAPGKDVPRHRFQPLADHHNPIMAGLFSAIRTSRRLLGSAERPASARQYFNRIDWNRES